MVKIRVDNQIVEALSDIVVTNTEIFIDGEKMDIVFPGEFSIELIEGSCSIDDDGNIVYKTE